MYYTKQKPLGYYTKKKYLKHKENTLSSKHYLTTFDRFQCLVDRQFSFQLSSQGKSLPTLFQPLSV